MPFYDLKCENCQHDFEIKASISERSENLIKCPQCGSTELAAVFKNVNVISSLNSCDSCEGSTVSRSAHCCSGGCCH